MHADAKRARAYGVFETLAAARCNYEGLAKVAHVIFVQILP